jgi:integrase/recombinase XerC
VFAINITDGKLEERLNHREATHEMYATTPPLIAEFLADLQLRKQITPRTREAYRYDLQVFFQYLVDQRIGDPPPSTWTAVDLTILQAVDYPLLRSYLLQYASPISTRHQQRKAAVLRSFFRYLTDVRELLPRNPALRLTVGQDRQQRRDDLARVMALDDNSVALFLRNVRTGCFLPSERARLYHARVWERDWAIVLLFLTSGLRLTELAGIAIGDLDLQRGQLRVLRKGGFTDWVPLHPDAAAAIQAYLGSAHRPVPAAGPVKEAPLFVSSTTGARLTGRQIENLVKKYAVTADKRLEYVSPHKLRHTFAQRIYDATGDLYLTAVALAHQSVESARIYAKVTEEQRQTAVGRLALDRWVRGQESGRLPGEADPAE